ncbi:MAG: hypothetical protein V8T86_01665 [Victivallis sp.]
MAEAEGYRGRYNNALPNLYNALLHIGIRAEVLQPPAKSAKACYRQREGAVHPVPAVRRSVDGEGAPPLR